MDLNSSPNYSSLPEAVNIFRQSILKQRVYQKQRNIVFKSYSPSNQSCSSLTHQATNRVQVIHPLIKKKCHPHYPPEKNNLVPRKSWLATSREQKKMNSQHHPSFFGFGGRGGKAGKPTTAAYPPTKNYQLSVSAFWS